MPGRRVSLDRANAAQEDGTRAWDAEGSVMAHVFSNGYPSLSVSATGER